MPAVHPAPTMSAADPRILLIAGELSGDLLGAQLICALRERLPRARFEGVAGPRMLEQGCSALESIDSLSVMGLAEVLPAIPRLLRLRARLIAHALATGPDLVIGIDAPDFNLGLERRLRDAGLTTVHVVSPTVWAWRQGRVHTIARSVRRILCLFPFEPPYYQAVGLPADYIGHPLADELDDGVSAAEARTALGLDPNRRCVAVLPGSRGGEIRHLAEPFAAAARCLAEGEGPLQFVTPVARPGLKGAISAAIAEHAPGLDWVLLDGDSRRAMQAADVVLLASGTATLECLLLGRPMVVGYRGNAFTAWLMLKAGLLKVRQVSLPNLLSDTPCVTELLQNDATPERLAAELRRLLHEPGLAEAQRESFRRTRETLRCNAARRAAELLVGMLH